MTILILMVVIVPFLLAVATIIERRMTLLSRQGAGYIHAALCQWVGKIPLVGQKITTLAAIATFAMKNSRPD